mgnify:CR=1 FL=1
MNRDNLDTQEAAYELHTDPESFDAAVGVLDALRAGTFYDNVPASAFANPAQHPRGADYVPSN